MKTHSPRLAINAARMQANIDALARLTLPEQPYTRRSFTPLYHQGRDLVAEWMREAGLLVTMDTAANLSGRRAGSVPGLAPIALGSHTDTVPGGGRFDGILGVVAAIEIARCLHEQGIRLRHPLEIFDYLAEEPSEFGLSTIGSRAMAGALTPNTCASLTPTSAPWPKASPRWAATPPGSITPAARPAPLPSRWNYTLNRGQPWRPHISPLASSPDW
jgi:N-carbamoyl-L-amino-acid hydrolase